RELTNKEITGYLLDATGRNWDYVDFVEDRLAHDRRYSVDDSKIRAELGYAPQRSFEAGLAETVQWYRDNRAWWEPLKDRCRARSVDAGRAESVQWYRDERAWWERLSDRGRGHRPRPPRPTSQSSSSRSSARSISRMRRVFAGMLRRLTARLCRCRQPRRNSSSATATCLRQGMAPAMAMAWRSSAGSARRAAAASGSGADITTLTMSCASARRPASSQSTNASRPSGSRRTLPRPGSPWLGPTVIGRTSASADFARRSSPTRSSSAGHNPSGAPATRPAKAV